MDTVLFYKSRQNISTDDDGFSCNQDANREYADDVYYRYSSWYRCTLQACDVESSLYYLGEADFTELSVVERALSSTVQGIYH